MKNGSIFLVRRVIKWFVFTKIVWKSLKKQTYKHYFLAGKFQLKFSKRKYAVTAPYIILCKKWHEKAINNLSTSSFSFGFTDNSRSSVRKAKRLARSLVKCTVQWLHVQRIVKRNTIVSRQLLTSQATNQYHTYLKG